MKQVHLGKMILGCFAVIVTAQGVAQIALSLFKNLISFCAVYDEEGTADPPFFDEIEERGAGDCACQEG